MEDPFARQQRTIDRLREENAAKHNGMIRYKRQLTECRERLAAVEARTRKALHLLSRVPELSGCDRLWWGRGERITLQHVNDWIAETCELMEYDDHIALDAALEQAKRYFIRALGGLSQAQGFARIEIHWDGTGGYGPFYDIWATRERDGLLLDKKQLSETELFEWLDQFVGDVEEVPDEPTL